MAISVPNGVRFSGIGHDTTRIGGKYVRDPRGNHFTFCYKDEEQVRRGTHTACHGYTPSPTNYKLTSVIITPEKADAIREQNNKPVWPTVGDENLLAGSTIGYGHK